MLNLSYLQETFAYEEICRRVTNPKTQDFDCKRVQNELREDGVPEKWIDSSRWEIEPVRVLGSGNPQLEQGQAMALLNIRPMLNPEAQAEVLNDYVYAMTHDPKRANRIAPIDAVVVVNDSVADTERVYGALMAGSKISPRPGLIATDVVATMLKEMDSTVQEVMQSGGVGTPQIVTGMQRAMAYTGSYLQQLAQDKTQQQLVKQFSDSFGQIANMVKAMAQRQQEIAAKQNGNGADPEAMQKLQMNQAMGQQKLQQKQQAHVQKLTQKQQDFALKSRMKQQQNLADIQTKAMTATAEAAMQPPKEVSEGGEE